jgi:hypothetical protein
VDVAGERHQRNHGFYGGDGIIADIMTISLKSAADIEGMRIAGRLGSKCWTC